MEHLEAPFYKAVQKEEDRRRKTKEEHVKKRKEKNTKVQYSDTFLKRDVEI